MDNISIQTIIDFVSKFGLTGAVIVMWWISDKSHQRTLAAYRDDMTELRQMYKNNVHLVEAHEALSKDLKEIIVMNTEIMTQLVESIRTNQYCPGVRLEKRAKGVQA